MNNHPKYVIIYPRRFVVGNNKYYLFIKYSLFYISDKKKVDFAILTDKKKVEVSSTDEKNIDIICPNKLVTFFNPMALLVFCLCQIAYKYETNCVAWVTIAYLMRCSTPVQQKKKKEIINALEDLCDLGFIERDKNWGYIINTRSFYNQTDGFERCSYNTLVALRDNAPLFQHYMLIKKGMIDGKCTYDINYFTRIENVSARTITRRNQDLVNMELIYIYRPLIDEEKNEYGNNTYVLYGDYKKTDKSVGNLNRSISLRYNSYIKDPAKFTPLMRKELIKQVKEYNARNPDRQKDLVVFDNA